MKTRILSLAASVLLLTACATAQDRNYVDGLDCKAMAEMQRTMPTAPAAIIDDWDRDQGAVRAQDKGILNQSRPAIRDSYLRREYAKKCK